MFLALLHTALWTRPPQVYGFDLSDCWAWMRYASAISANLAMQLRPEWTALDPHHKTILSDELGVGVTTCLLADALGCLEYISTSYAVASVFPTQFRSIAKAKRGPSKAPDYIARLSNGHFAVLECKGSQTSPRVLRHAMDDGRNQKANLTATSGTTISHSLVAGLFIPQANSRQRAEVVIADPVLSGVAILLAEASVEALTLASVQLAVAQQFALAGMADAANLVATPPIDRLSNVREPLLRLLEKRSTATGTHGIPFTGEKEQDGSATLQFKFEAGALIRAFQDGSSLEDSLHQLASRRASLGGSIVGATTTSQSFS